MLAPELRLRTSPELMAARAGALAAGRTAEAAALADEIDLRLRRYFTGEMLDVYDDSLRPAGTRERGAVHLDGDWHRSFHCWLVSPARGTLLVQRRALAKATYPGALDVSVAGHYRAGEGLVEVCREGEEELGLPLPPAALVPLGRAVDMARHGILIDREVADVYGYVTDVEPAALGLDAREVASVLDLPLPAALALFCGAADRVQALEWAPGLAPRAVAVTCADFTGHHDRYYARLALQAGRLAAGLPPLCI